MLEIHQDGVTLFRGLRSVIKDADTKAQAAALGLKIFPDAAEEQSTMVRMQAYVRPSVRACMHVKGSKGARRDRIILLLMCVCSRRAGRKAAPAC